MTSARWAVTGAMAELRATETFVQIAHDRLGLALAEMDEQARLPSALTRVRHARRAAVTRSAAFAIVGACGALQALIRQLLVALDPAIADRADDAAEVARSRVLREAA
jgi:hypothetical protein